MKLQTAECRPARAADVPAVCSLVNHWASQSLMLPRSEKEVLSSLGDFAVLEREGRVLATGALASYGEDLAELRSVAVAAGMQTKGLGRLLVEFLIERARREGYPRIFAFTYVPGFFEKFGFRIVPPESLPQKTKKDCCYCLKREGCDEIAMIRDLP